MNKILTVIKTKDNSKRLSFALTENKGKNKPRFCQIHYNNRLIYSICINEKDSAITMFSFYIGHYQFKLTDIISGIHPFNLK